MGNFSSIPRQRLRFEVRFDQDDKELVRHTLRKIADDAEVSAQLGRQRHERRKQRYEVGYGQSGSRTRHPGRGGFPGETFATAPEYPPFGPQGGMSPRFPPHQDPPGVPLGATGTYGDYRGYQPHATDGEQDEEAFGDDDLDDHSPSGRHFDARAVPKGPGRGRNRQAPLTRRPRRQEPQQDPTTNFMTGDGPAGEQQ
ncbi:MAG: hypothetical protein Q9216_001050 [Gyalolechia sp. 2 TL-2023]